MNQLHLDTLNRISVSAPLCMEFILRLIVRIGKSNTACTILDQDSKDRDHLAETLDYFAQRFAEQHHKNDPSKPNPNAH